MSVNNLWWITEQQMLDVIHRREFPLVEAQRIQALVVQDQANLVAAADYAARPFMERPHRDDCVKVKRWVMASRESFGL